MNNKLSALFIIVMLTMASAISTNSIASKNRSYAKLKNQPSGTGSTTSTDNTVNANINANVNTTSNITNNTDNTTDTTPFTPPKREPHQLPKNAELPKDEVIINPNLDELKFGNGYEDSESFKYQMKILKELKEISEYMPEDDESSIVATIREQITYYERRAKKLHRTIEIKEEIMLYKNNVDEQHIITIEDDIDYLKNMLKDIEKDIKALYEFAEREEEEYEEIHKEYLKEEAGKQKLKEKDDKLLNDAKNNQHLADNLDMLNYNRLNLDNTTNTNSKATVNANSNTDATNHNDTTSTTFVEDHNMMSHEHPDFNHANSGDHNPFFNQVEMKNIVSKVNTHIANKNKKTLNKKSLKTLKGTNLITMEDAQVNTGIAASCVRGFMSSIPPNFCYKRNADFGVANFTTPWGFFQWGAGYVQNCNHGYVWNGFQCAVRSCNHGYADFGAFCSHTSCSWHRCGWFSCLRCGTHTYWKHTYWPLGITRFDYRVGCSDHSRYKSGALCYRKCSNYLGIENCGIGACSLSQPMCAAGIIQMIVEFLVGAVTMALFVATFGASSAAQPATAAASQATKTGVRASLQGVQKSAQAMFKTIHKIFTNATYRAAITRAMTQAAWAAFVKTAVKGVLYGTVYAVCKGVGDLIMADIIAKQGKQQFQLKDLDISGVSDSVTNCNAIKGNPTHNQKTKCAKSILYVISWIDPTGLTAMASALMQEVCPV